MDLLDFCGESKKKFENKIVEYKTIETIFHPNHPLKFSKQIFEKSSEQKYYR